MRATPEHSGAIMEIIQMGKNHLKEQGIDQWQKGSPNQDMVEHDIAQGDGYILVENQEIVAYAFIGFQGEPCYQEIRGAWDCEGPYLVVHRFAVADRFRGKGLTDQIFELIVAYGQSAKVESFRIDTHHENAKMQHILIKQGFRFCGSVTLSEGLRMAFEKRI